MSLTVPYHDDAVFSVQVTGTSPFSYQWRRNGGNIADGTESTYTRTSVEAVVDEGLVDLLDHRVDTHVLVVDDDHRV